MNVRWTGRVALLTALVFLCAAVAVGCAPEEAVEDPDDPEDPEPTEEELPDPDTLVAARDMPTTLDPGKANDVCSAMPLRGIYETLVRYKGSSTDELEPALARDWEVCPDALTYTFYLREGVKFHDGTPFDADAVKFSFERAIELGHAPADIFDPVDTMEILDSHTLQITLAYPYAPFLFTLAGQVGPLIVSPTAVREHEVDGDLASDWLHENTAGTGPYMLEEWVPEQRVVLTKFDDYWGGWDKPHFSEIIIRNIVEPATCRMLLEKGDIDLTVFSSQDDWPAFEENPDINLNRNPSLNTLYHMINQIKAPLDDPRVRKAITLAYDAESVIERVYMGYGYELKGILPSTLWGHPDDLAAPDYDLERAAELLEDAGHPGGGFELEYLYVEGSERARQSAEILQAGLAEIGVQLELQPMPWPTLWASISDPDTAPHMYAFFWFPRVADPDNWFYTMFHSSMQGEAGYNCIYYSNPEVDELLDAGRRTQAMDERVQMYERVEHILAEDVAVVPVAQEDVAYPMGAWIEGYVFNPNYIGTFNFYDMYRAD